MNAKYIVLATPIFFLLIGLELWQNRRRSGDWGYRYHDTLTNLSCGIGSQILLAFTGGLGLLIYHFLQRRCGLLAISPRAAWAWVALLFLDDFCYYVFHRASHRSGFLWATHAVHHQSEEYNLSAALRQSWFASVTSWVFYLPLAVLGFPLAMYVTIRTINTLYQFWIHTRAVSRIGLWEWLLNTPSHHRVHHGINAHYLDKNYAGIFILWDRLLGTFTAEAEEPVYGTVKPLQSWNPVWANLAEWARLLQLMRAARRPLDKLRVWWMPPGWRPQDLGGPLAIPQVSRAAQRKYDVRAPAVRNLYVGISFLLALGAAVWLLIHQQELGVLGHGVVSGQIVLALLVCGAIIEGQRWAWPLEAARLLSLFALLYGLRA